MGQNRASGSTSALHLGHALRPRLDPHWLQNLASLLLSALQTEHFIRRPLCAHPMVFSRFVPALGEATRQLYRVPAAGASSLAPPLGILSTGRVACEWAL